MTGLAQGRHGDPDLTSAKEHTCSVQSQGEARAKVSEEVKGFLGVSTANGLGSWPGS